MIPCKKYFLKHILLILSIICPFVLLSQNKKIEFYAGSAIGGPAPTQIADSSYAKLKHGISAGTSYLLFKKNQFSVNTEVSYQLIRLGYGQNLQNDTTVQVQLPMQNGDTLTTNINTYYKASVSGAMRLNYIKAGTNFSYSYKKITFTLGTYFTYLIGGYDKGNVHVTIGEGGVAGLDDIDQEFDNTEGINKTGFEFLLRTKYQVYKNLSLGLQVSRAFSTFYNKDFLIRGERIKFYNTILGINISYSFF